MDVAIIGHGKSVVGKRWGKKIDACECVVRCWNCHWQDEEDWGAKYDYGLFEAHVSCLLPFLRDNERTPDKGWVGVLWEKMPKPVAVPARTKFFDPMKYRRMGQAMGGHSAHMHSYLSFSRGTVAALWALEELKAERLVLVGFDNVAAGKCLPIEDGFPDAYVATRTYWEPDNGLFEGYTPGEVRHGGHDFSIERHLLEHVAIKGGIALAFAEEVW